MDASLSRRELLQLAGSAALLTTTAVTPSAAAAAMAGALFKNARRFDFSILYLLMGAGFNPSQRASPV